MINPKRPYLIEGLDCSGKKTIAKLVQIKLEAEGKIPVKLVIGSFVNSPIKTVDKVISNPSKFSKIKWVHKSLAQVIYTIAPVVDFYFYKPNGKYLPIKISSHYRSMAKATIDNDSFMLNNYKHFKNISIKYHGATILTTSFETRIRRHKLDFESGKTNKDEVKRFYQNNKNLFLNWDNILSELMIDEIKSVQILENDGKPLSEIADAVISHIYGIYKL